MRCKVQKFTDLRTLTSTAGKEENFQEGNKGICINRMCESTYLIHVSMRDFLGKNSKPGLSLLSSSLNLFHPRGALFTCSNYSCFPFRELRPDALLSPVLYFYSVIHVHILFAFEFSPFLNCKPHEGKGPQLMCSQGLAIQCPQNDS